MNCAEESSEIGYRIVDKIETEVIAIDEGAVVPKADPSDRTAVQQSETQPKEDVPMKVLSTIRKSAFELLCHSA